VTEYFGFELVFDEILTKNRLFGVKGQLFYLLLSI